MSSICEKCRHTSNHTCKNKGVVDSKASDSPAREYICHWCVHDFTGWTHYVNKRGTRGPKLTVEEYNQLGIRLKGIGCEGCIAAWRRAYVPVCICQEVACDCDSCVEQYP